MSNKINVLLFWERIFLNMFLISLLYFPAKGQSVKEINKYFIRKVNSKDIEFYIGDFKKDTVKIKFIKSEQVETDYYNSPKIFIGNTMLQGEFPYYDIIMDSKSTSVLSNKSMRYILLRQKGFVDVDNFLVFCVKNKSLISIEKAVYSKITDADNDGKLEIGGFHLSEVPCRECDSVYYNPAEIFELGESFCFDSLESKLATIRFYGVFLGYQPLDTVLPLPRK
jgi:hypothetical protein